MVRLLLILWIALLSFQSGYRGLAYVYYLWNKDFVKKNLCENRAMPQLKCEGKCHLKKVLNSAKVASTEKPDSPAIPNMELLKNTFLFIQSLDSMINWVALDSYDEFLREGQFAYLFNYRYTPLFKLVRPPAL